MQSFAFISGYATPSACLPSLAQQGEAKQASVAFFAPLALLRMAVKSKKRSNSLLLFFCFLFRLRLN
jgi:hypothetical protein